MKTSLLSFLGLWAVVESSVIPTLESKSNIFARSNDPADFSWVTRWAAIGDSFTAGIGSGVPLNVAPEDWYCSRYDKSYPMIVNSALGPSVKSFQFLACSGDRTGGIYKQIQALQGELDLVLLTAGGNDLCLSSLILKCVFRAFDGEDACTSVITIAQANLNTILKPNLKMLMEALNDKMNPDSIVVFNGYAQFFNTDNEDCATNQDWTVYNVLGQTSLTLTIARRKTFNNLVVQINNMIKTVVEETASNSTLNYKIGFSNWDLWPSEGVSGQYCDPSSTGRYPDTAQPDLQFFKRDTNKNSPDPGELRRRDSGNDRIDQHPPSEETHKRNVQDEIYNSLLYKSENPQAVARHNLDRRAPSPPGCPGDTNDDIQPKPLVGVPDYLGKNFHPNELGHYTIASWSLQTIMDVRAEILNVQAPSCPAVDKFSCWRWHGSQRYASAARLNSHFRSFCEDAEVRGPADLKNFRKDYDQFTRDAAYFRVVLVGDTTTTDKTECIATMAHIINACDGNDPGNPMNWKFGGEWRRGNRIYQVVPNTFYPRPWPVIQQPIGRCTGWYHFLYSSFEIEGAGWSDWDHGGETLYPSIRNCIGSKPSEWHFDYYKKPTSEGYEWKATFRTPIWVRNRCFKNNKVVSSIGGVTNGCAGND